MNLFIKTLIFHNNTLRGIMQFSPLLLLNKLYEICLNHFQKIRSENNFNGFKLFAKTQI
jgi:hypothetical protein